jgi:hypothetical protein
MAREIIIIIRINHLLSNTVFSVRASATAAAAIIGRYFADSYC